MSLRDCLCVIACRTDQIRSLNFESKSLKSKQQARIDMKRVSDNAIVSWHHALTVDWSLEVVWNQSLESESEADSNRKLRTCMFAQSQLTIFSTDAIHMGINGKHPFQNGVIMCTSRYELRPDAYL